MKKMLDVHSTKETVVITGMRYSVTKLLFEWMSDPDMAKVKYLRFSISLDFVSTKFQQIYFQIDRPRNQESANPFATNLHTSMGSAASDPFPKNEVDFQHIALPILQDACTALMYTSRRAWHLVTPGISSCRDSYEGWCERIDR